MNFKCEQLTISIDPDFGCTIEFSDSKDEVDEFTPIEELFHPKGKYLLIQRSFPEEEDDVDWYSIESSESEIELNFKDKMIITMTRDYFEIGWSGERLTIGLDLSDKEYFQLEKTLKTMFKEKILLFKG